MRWHLDPKVTIGMIFAIVIAFGRGEFRAANHSTRIEKIEEQIAAGQLPTADKRLSLIELRLLSIERKLDNLIIPYPLDN